MDTTTRSRANPQGGLGRTGIRSGAAPAKPWFREPWPWFIMAGPAIVVVAGFFTFWLAVRSDDGLVAEDYYRRGLAINRDIARTEASAAAGIAAVLTIRDGVATIRLVTRGAEPEVLRLSLRHPTRAGLDHMAELRRIAVGTYSAAFPPIAEGNWRIAVETPQWKLAAEAVVRSGEEISLQP